MSMPQHLSIVVISEKGEKAAVVATLLREGWSGVHPDFAAVSSDPDCRPELAKSMASRGLTLQAPVLPLFVNPRCVDLWLALDPGGEASALRSISNFGPPPEGYYRHVWPSAVALWQKRVPNPPLKFGLDKWIEKLEESSKLWSDRIRAAFEESS